MNTDSHKDFTEVGEKLNDPRPLVRMVFIHNKASVSPRLFEENVSTNTKQC